MVGTGPGPFTGLRVGMVTAAALGDALEIPVHGVCSLDAIAAEAVPDTGALGGPLLVATDARRREVYWAAYDEAGARTTGPHVETPAALAARLPELGVTVAAGRQRRRSRAARGRADHTGARRPRRLRGGRAAGRGAPGPAGAAVPAPAGRRRAGPAQAGDGAG